MKNPLSTLRLSLKWKLTLVFVAMVIVIMAVNTYLFSIREQSLQIDQVNLRMERLANNIASIRAVETEDWDVYRTYAEHQLVLNHDIVYIAIYDENGQLKVNALNTDWIDLGGREVLSQREEASIVWRLDQGQIEENSQRDMSSKSVNIIIGDQNRGIVKVGFSMIELNDELRKNLVRNLQLALGFLLFAVLISLYVSQRIITPLRKLTAAMSRISKGDLDQSINVVSGDEIGKMTHTFNFMARGLREKRHLEDFSRELGYSLEFESIASVVTERLCMAMDAQKGLLFMLEDNAMKLHNAYPDSGIECKPINVSVKLLDTLSRIKEPIELRKLMNREFSDTLNTCIEPGKFALIYPVMLKDEMVGLYMLDDPKTQRSYSTAETHFFTTLVQQAVFAIDNALLLEERTERERMKRELEIARTVQMSLLPQSIPEMPGLEIDGICIPAAEVGGDYYDYFVLGDSRMGVVIADVTGKGTSAAFYMAMIKGMMTSLAPVFDSPKRLLSQLNRRLFGIMDRQMFVTMNYAILDLKKKQLTFARAGHCTLLKREGVSGDVDFMMPMGIGMGLESGETFERTITEETTGMNSGDRFLFYTDGITEAMSPDQEEFGEVRLHDLFKKADGKSAKKTTELILASLKTYTGDAPQHDDITMVNISVN